MGIKETLSGAWDDLTEIVSPARKKARLEKEKQLRDEQTAREVVARVALRGLDEEQAELSPLAGDPDWVRTRMKLALGQFSTKEDIDKMRKEVLKHKY